MRNYLQKRIVNNAFSVSELAKIYQFPSYKQTNQVIMIPSFGGGIYGTIENNILINGDVQKYWALQGIPDMSMSTVYVYNSEIMDFTDETSTLENIMDISVVGSCCQCIIILCLFPNNISFLEAFTTMINGITINGSTFYPSIISMSWGMPETDADILDLTQTNSLLKRTNINVCVAAGDNGSSDGKSTLTVDYPASSPYVTAVGGTSLICPNIFYDSSTNETVWNDGTTATGGGISIFFSKPTYQTFLPGTYRNVPDLAFNADPNTGIQLYFNGQIQYGIGGTSMCAPLFAAYLALVTIPNTILSFINPLLYSNTCFHDITIGSNSIGYRGQYYAKTGYDNCTGLGSLIGNKLVNPYIKLPQSMTIRKGFIYHIPIQTNLNVVWSSSNKNVLVNQNGFILGMNIGTAIITARANNLSVSTTVTVQNPKTLILY
jgi:kumamolisin